MAIDKEKDKSQVLFIAALPYTRSPLVGWDWWFGFGFEPVVLVEGRWDSSP